MPGLWSWREPPARLPAAIPLEPSRDGGWFLRLPDGRLACSARSPRDEARRLCDSLPSIDDVLLLGAGLGYEMDELAARGASGLLVVEADLRVVAGVLERWRREGRDAPPAERCRLLHAQGDGALCDALAKALRHDHGERPVLVRPATPDAWEALAPRAASLARDLLRSRTSARRQEERLAANEAANEPMLAAARPVVDVDGLWGDAPVAVCGAGPSLGSSWEMLARLRAAGGRLLAASTALPALVAAGLPPDVVVATDPSPLLADDLPPAGSAWRPPLLVFPGTSRELVARWPGPLWWALPEGPGLHRDEFHGRRPGRLRAGCGTVAGPGLALAARLSGGPLWLCGVDLSAKDGMYTAGVRRPDSPMRPDFGFAGRRMAELVLELRGSGRQVLPMGRPPHWFPGEERA